MHAIARPARASLRRVQRLLHTSAPVAAESSSREGAASSSSSKSNSDSGSSSSSSSVRTASPPRNKPQQSQQKQKQPAKPEEPARISPLNFDLSTFPSLLKASHPILDSGIHSRREASATQPFPSNVHIYNEPRYFDSMMPSAATLALSSGLSSGVFDAAAYLSNVTPLSKEEVNALHRYTLSISRVVKMTGKGKNSRMRALVVAGNGRGLVGVGEGKDQNAGKAGRKAFQDAVKNLDYVERYEGRTIAADVKATFRATEVQLRPRPAGFGLRVPPAIHALSRAAGIADLSAKIIGSTNSANVVKATLMMLCGGASPIGLGDGIGGPGRRKDKGAGMRSVKEIEWARGRRIMDVPAQSPPRKVR